MLAAIDRGTPTEEVAKTFSVSMPTIKRWFRRRHETGEWMPKHLEENPDLTLEEHSEAFGEARDVSASIFSTVGRRAIARLPGGGWPLEKSHR